MSNKIITGALIGTIIGAVAVALSPKRRREILETITDHADDFNDNVKEYAQHLLKNGKRLVGLQVKPDRTAFWWTAAIAGLLAGAGAAAFLSPKTGKHLRGQAVRVYKDLLEKAQNTIRDFKKSPHPIFTFTNNHHPVKKRRTLLKPRT